jgi:hypothetical protein
LICPKKLKYVTRKELRKVHFLTLFLTTLGTEKSYLTGSGKKSLIQLVHTQKEKYFFMTFLLNGQVFKIFKYFNQNIALHSS